MVFRQVYVLPILFGFWMPVAVLITYTVSVLTQHVTPILPYISDTGTWAPESCIFGIMITLGALLMASITYIRFRHVQDVQQKNGYPLNLRKINKYSMYLALVSICGCLVVANFQVTLILVAHITGAGVCFGFGVLYQITQVILSFKMYPTIGNNKVNIFRVIVTTISGISFLSTLICALLSVMQFKASDMTKWKMEDGGYVFHLISAVSEYILVIATITHLVTFVEEFKTIEIHQPKISTKTREVQDMSK